MATPNNEVASIRVYPGRENKLEVSFGSGLYSALNGEWQGEPPTAAQVRKAKAAITAAFPKAHKAPKKG